MTAFITLDGETSEDVAHQGTDDVYPCLMVRRRCDFMAGTFRLETCNIEDVFPLPNAKEPDYCVSSYLMNGIGTVQLVLSTDSSQCFEVQETLVTLAISPAILLNSSSSLDNPSIPLFLLSFKFKTSLCSSLIFGIRNVFSYVDKDTIIFRELKGYDSYFYRKMTIGKAENFPFIYTRAFTVCHFKISLLCDTSVYRPC